MESRAGTPASAPPTRGSSSRNNAGLRTRVCVDLRLGNRRPALVEGRPSAATYVLEAAAACRQFAKGVRGVPFIESLLLTGR